MSIGPVLPRILFYQTTMVWFSLNSIEVSDAQNGWHKPRCRAENLAGYCCQEQSQWLDRPARQLNQCKFGLSLQMEGHENKLDARI